MQCCPRATATASVALQGMSYNFKTSKNYNNSTGNPDPQKFVFFLKIVPENADFTNLLTSSKMTAIFEMSS
jgi:hypothetical protein